MEVEGDQEESVKVSPVEAAAAAATLGALAAFGAEAEAGADLLDPFKFAASQFEAAPRLTPF